MTTCDSSDHSTLHSSAAPVWNHLLTITQTDQIEAIQRRAVRIIYSYTNDMPYISARAAIPSLADRREQLSRVF